MLKFLDCTLRDGGYINNWKFGINKIKNYIDLIVNSNVDFVEIGFLTDEKRNKNQTLFNTLYEANGYIKDFNKITLMIAQGKYDIRKLPRYSINTIKNIRYIFKYHERKTALKNAKKIKQKGYNLFINPTFISQYNLREFTDLTKEINEINPNYFTLVDSMGVLDGKRFLNLIEITDKNLNPGISLAVHLHNNLNFAKENIELLKNLKLNREIMVDATISGIGRGFGNVILENYIQIDKKIKILLKDEIKKFLSMDKNCYKLASENNCHPCYATYLNRNCIEADKMNTVFQSIPEEFKTSYNRNLIEKLVNNFK